MTRTDLSNILRVMDSLDRHELETAGVLTIGDHEAWARFKRDPNRWYVVANDFAQDKLFDLIMQRHRPVAPFLSDKAKPLQMVDLKRDHHFGDCALIYFSRRPTDAELAFLHDCICRAVELIPADINSPSGH